MIEKNIDLGLKKHINEFLSMRFVLPARNMFNVHPERDPRDDDKKDGRDVRLHLKYKGQFYKMKHKKSSIMEMYNWGLNIQ